MNSHRVLSLIMPTYNAASTILETLQTLTSQHLPDAWKLEIIVSDNCSTDATYSMIAAIPDPRISLWRNDTNLGYPENLNRALSHSTGEIVVLFGSDDLMAENYLHSVIKLFEDDQMVGAITRPYFAYDDDIRRPVRYKRLPSDWFSNPQTFDIKSDHSALRWVFSTLDQFSGLAFRRQDLRVPFHEDVFPCHVYPFAEILTRKRVAVLPIYAVAVLTSTSQSRHISSIYDKSPVQSWVDLFESTFSENEYGSFREYMVREFCANNAVGLLQIRNYASKPIRYTVREITVMIRRRPKNLIDPVFLLVVVLCTVIPPIFLRRIVDIFKRRISSRTVPPIRFVQSRMSV